jgi:hypothetical protein
MPEEITYYAMRLSTRESGEPTGIARRRVFSEGGIVDEALKKDLRWSHTPLIVAWERGDLSVHLEQIGQAQAERLVAQLRARWQESGLTDDGG